MGKGDERFNGGENRRVTGGVELERGPWVILEQCIQIRGLILDMGRGMKGCQ